MRKFLSILLLALFCVTLVEPLLALGAGEDAGLPACCRRFGAHHCSMGATEGAHLHGRRPGFAALVGKCPFYPRSVAVNQSHVLAPPSAQAIFAALVSHPAGTAQLASMRRIAQDRSRQKRGPPSLLV